MHFKQPEDRSAALERLREIVLANVARGEVSRRVMEFLFRIFGQLDRIVANDISENGGPHGDGNVAAHMARLREALIEFFDWHPIGRGEEYRIVLIAGDPGNYALVIEPNEPPTDLLSKLLSPHFPPNRTRLVYPERLCSCSGEAHAVRSDNLDDEDDASEESSEGGAELSRGLVSTSYIRSMVRFYTCFQTWQVPLGSVAVQRSTRHVDGNLLVLGTPSDLPLILPLLEATALMKTTCDGVTVNGSRDKRPQLYRDTLDHPMTPKGTELVKWAVLTRHYYRYQRTLTVLAAKDELAVEAVARVLTDENALLMLARELKCRESFPDHFQALFAVHMVKGHPYARSINVERVIDLGRAA